MGQSRRVIRGFQVECGSTERRAWARQAHAEAHAILALRDAHTRLLVLGSVDEALEDIQRDIAYRAARLNLPPDAICDALEEARLEEARAAANFEMCRCGGF
jgi:hypothetical protein